jgi:SAM-dependent methyltransferase
MLPPVNNYRWLAQYFDRVFSFAPAWGEPARRKILEPILPQVRSACDLACGTGHTAIALAGRGIRTFGVDLSPGMCRAARQNVRAAQVPVRIIRADMRDFRLPEAVDLVTCEFDALNHVPAESDLGLVAKCVARALRPGGWFYFDVNNSPAFQAMWPDTTWLDTPDVAAVMHGGYDRERDRAWSDVEWFIREGRLWRRRRERVVEVCWTAAEIRRALRAAGFGRIRAWDAAPILKADATIRPGFRTYFLARKAYTPRRRLRD